MKRRPPYYRPDGNTAWRMCASKRRFRTREEARRRTRGTGHIAVSFVGNGTLHRIGVVEMSSSNYVHLDVQLVKKATDKALLCVIDGEEVWLPLSQVADA